MLFRSSEICSREGIRLGMVQGLGAADRVVIGLYDVGSRIYHKTTLEGPMEITSLAGNISRKDGAPYLHMHINVCDQQMHVLGGHLNECRISATAEIFIRSMAGEVGRRLDEAVTGLNLYQFD
ncbi:MAG: DNA-binding protein [Mailhella sp.]|nr:DNA-binding protein [Mailhella sp.]